MDLGLGGGVGHILVRGARGVQVQHLGIGGGVFHVGLKFLRVRVLGTERVGRCSCK